MITAIGNNFGAGQISLKDYQNEKLVVLNGKFSFNNKAEAFLSVSSVMGVYGQGFDTIKVKGKN